MTVTNLPVYNELMNDCMSRASSD